MKKTISILSLVIFFQVNSQSIGIGLGYASTNAFNAEFLYLSNNNIFKLGATLQLSETQGKLVREQLPNHGRTTNGMGEYFVTVDMGYGKIIKNFTFETEISIGSNNDYTNYIDNRFNNGGYHLITDRKARIGAGVSGGYIYDNTWNFIIGYNTIRKFQIGVRILL